MGKRKKKFGHQLVGKKCSFFGKFGVLCFLVTSAVRFALLLYYRRNKVYCHCKLVLFELGHTFTEKLGTLERLSVHKLIVMDCTIN